MSVIIATPCPRYESEEIDCEGVWNWQTDGRHIVELHSRSCDHAIDSTQDCLSRADAVALLALRNRETTEAA